MEAPKERNSEENSAEAEAHIASAHEILNALQDNIGEHPEIGAHHEAGDGAECSRGTDGRVAVRRGRGTRI